MKLSGATALSVLTLCAIGAGLVFRFSVQAHAAEKARPSTQPPLLKVVFPTPAPVLVSLTLPGSLRPREHVVLYARTNGFLRQWLVDLGDAVKKGEVLARIDAPELGSNLAQARARLNQAQASLVLVRGQHQRTEALAKSGTASPQDADASSLRLAAAESDVAFSQAEVERLSALVSYLTVTAPFDGTVTRRLVDNGALVTAGTTALFEVASTDDLRVDVEVPQWLASQVKPGTPAKVTIGRDAAAHDAEVSRTSGSLDPVLRTLRVELVFKPNPGNVVPGSYARVKFEVPRAEPALQLPGAALSMRNGASTVAVVQPDGTVHFLPVKLVRDLGRDVEVQGELQPATKVGLFVPAAMIEGDKVTPVEGGK